MAKSRSGGGISPHEAAPPDEHQRLAIIDLLESALARLDALRGPKDAAAYVQMAIDAMENTEQNSRT